ncbi:MAG TPA: hypothetical protein VFZ53_15480 [Polyangiaceae bacterium]
MTVAYGFAAATIACALFFAGCEPSRSRSEQSTAVASSARPPASVASGEGAGSRPVWLAGSAGWLRAGPRECATSVAEQPRALWPGRTFRDCGAGCRESPVLPGFADAVAAELGSAARAADGSLYLSISARTAAEPPLFLLGTFRYGDGAPVVLVKAERCYAQFAGRASAATFRLFPPTGRGPRSLASFELGDAPAVRWSPREPPVDGELFDFDGGYGNLADFSRLSIATASANAELRVVRESEGTLRSPVALGARVFWLEWDGARGGVALLEPGQAPLTLVSREAYPVRLAVSDERIVWLAATGAGAAEGRYDSARLYGCAFAAGGRTCVVNDELELSVQGSTGPLLTFGTNAAFTGCSSERCDVYVIDLAAGAVRRVLGESGLELRVLGLTRSELLVAVQTGATRGSADFDRLRSYELARFADFSTRVR